MRGVLHRLHKWDCIVRVLCYAKRLVSRGRDLKIEETEFVDTNIKLELMEDSDRFVHQYQSDAQDQHPQEAQ